MEKVWVKYRFGDAVKKTMIGELFDVAEHHVHRMMFDELRKHSSFKIKKEQADDFSGDTIYTSEIYVCKLEELIKLRKALQDIGKCSPQISESLKRAFEEFTKSKEPISNL